MIVLSSLADACNYGSSLVFSHMLSAGAYGDLTALLALTTIVAVPTGAAQTVIAERVAVLTAEGNNERLRYLIRYASAHALTLATIVGVIYIACIPAMKSTLGLQNIGPALAMLPLVVLAVVIPVFYGVLQGMERFVVLGSLTLIVAASRIIFGVPWVLADGGAGGPLFGQALGTLVAIVIALIVLRAYLLRRGTGAAASGLRRIPDRRTLAAAGAFIGFALLSNLDVLLAKIFLAPHAAGEYAALVTVEKAIIFLPSAVAIVLVPAAAKARVEDGSTARILRLAALLVAGTLLISAIPPLVAPHLLLRVMFGAKYQAAAGGLRPITAAGAALSLLYLLVVYTVAIQDRRWGWLLMGGVLIQVAAISLFHHSPTQIAEAQGASITLILALNEFFYHPLLRSERWFVGSLRGASPGSDPPQDRK
jgi:O-antigen/teichoic acid export membrane protein